MRAVLTDPFVAAFLKAPPEVQKLFGKQLAHLLRDWHHPSLQAKKFDRVAGTWRYQARINDDWRLYYRLEGDAFYLLDIIPHPK